MIRFHMPFNYGTKVFTKTISWLMIGAFVLTGIPLHSGIARASAGESSYDEILVLKGDIQTIRTNNLKRVSITQPEVADINDARANAVEVIGLEPGQTVLFIWDDMGKRTISVRVVTEDLGVLKKRIESLLESAGLKGLTINENNYEGKVVVTGELPEEKIVVLKSLVDPLGDRVINLVQKEKIEDLVQIDMQVTELSTTLTKALGIEWLTGTQTGSPTEGYVTETSDGFSPTAGEIMPQQDGSVGDIFKLGKFYRMTNSALVAKVNAMITEGKGKILSKPRLVVVSGKEATIQVGGQVPLKSSTVNTSGTTETITFKDYGITMVMTPTIENGKMVNILLNITISDIDTATYFNTSSSGSVAFLTRSAQTQVVLEDRQTVVFAGMIKRRSGETVKRVPLLGSIPVLGMLFRSKNTPNDSETEVVISITPTILRTLKNKIEQKKEEMETSFVKEESALANKAAVDVKVKADNDAVATEKVAPAEEAGVTPAAVPVAVPVAAVAMPEKAVEKAVEKTANKTAVTVKPVISKVVPPVKVPPPVVSTPGSASEKYALSVQQKILSAIAYPYEAQEKGWEGTVKLTLVLQRDGTLQSVVVKDSSGHEVFDQDAINTAQILAPYAALPSEIEANEMTVTIPIVYSLDGFLKNVASQ
jgi:pilus assembly protein CpaC